MGTKFDPNDKKNRILDEGQMTERRLKRIIAAVVLIILVGVIVAVAYGAAHATPEEVVNTTGNLIIDTRSSDEKKGTSDLVEALKDRQVFFAGIEDAVITKSTTIFLENVEENEDILMKYDIVDKETGETLESTGLIPAGEHIEWKAGEVLSEGEHTLIFRETPYFPWEEAQDGYVQLTQANNEVILTVQ